MKDTRVASLKKGNEKGNESVLCFDTKNWTRNHIRNIFFFLNNKILRIKKRNKQLMVCGLSFFGQYLCDHFNIIPVA